MLISNLVSYPDVSAILINWNALSLTSAALTSLKNQTSEVGYEVFVVDNGSTRDQSVYEMSRRFPWITFITNATNQGFTKASNQAIRRATGRYVLLLNNDTVQTGNALGESVRYMDAHPDVGALGILHLNHDEKRTFQPSYFSFPEPWADSLGLLGLRGAASSAPLPVEALKEADVDWVCGSFLLIRRKCLEQVGELDERFFSYDEDIDWCKRAHQAGWKVRFWSGASIVHLGSAAKPFLKDKTFMMFRSHLSYYFKHHGFLAAAVYYLAMAVRLTLAAAWQFLRLTLGRGQSADLRERSTRLIQFLFLRPGKLGG